MAARGGLYIRCVSISSRARTGARFGANGGAYLVSDVVYDTTSTFTQPEVTLQGRHEAAANLSPNLSPGRIHRTGTDVRKARRSGLGHATAGGRSVPVLRPQEGWSDS